MHVLDRVRRTIRTHALADSRTTVVVALSGGSDSVALACLLHELQRHRELRVAGLAHFGHGLREAAAAEQQFCHELASAMEYPLFTGKGDVAARARAERCSIETAARRARHAFLESARQHFSADVIALGHTRDDQAETFLLRLLRGAGTRGLAAMHPRRGALIRPLLDCRRDELRAFLDARGVRYVHDESNDDVAIPRNRVRAELLPLLAARFNPSIVDVLAAEAAIARDEWLWMEGATGEVMKRVVRQDGESVRVDAAALTDLPAALARRVARHAVEMAARRPVGYRHVEEVLAAARCAAAPVDGPGYRLERLGSDVVLTSRPAGRGRPACPGNVFRVPLSIPGEARLPTGWMLTAEIGVAAPDGAAVRDPATAVVSLERCRAPLSVRNRQAGDRFGPVGLRGHKKLQDYFVDRKVARGARDLVPLVVDADNRIVWVAGHAIDREFAVTGPAQAVLILRLKHWGGGS